MGHVYHRAILGIINVFLLSYNNTAYCDTLVDFFFNCPVETAFGEFRLRNIRCQG